MKTISDCCLRNLKLNIYIYIFPNSLILYIVYWPIDNFPTSREFIFWKRGLTLVLLKSSGTIPVATDFLTMDKIGYLI